MELVIRPARSDDVERIVEVERAADVRFAAVDLQAVLDPPQAEAEDHAEAQTDGRVFVVGAPAWAPYDRRAFHLT